MRLLKETKDKIKDLKTSAKILPLAKKLDTLLSKTESQMTILRRNQVEIKEKFREYSYKDLQQEDGLTDVERIDSNNLCNSGGEDADDSIMNTNYTANGTTLEADNNCQPMGYMSSCERPMGHQEQTIAQGQAALQETLVTVTVASKGALAIQKPKRQKQKKRKKNMMKFSARSKRTLNSRNWRKSQFYRKLGHKKRKPGFQRGKKVLQRKKATKKSHTDHTRKGQNANGVGITVSHYFRLWRKHKRKRLFIKSERACHRRKVIHCEKKTGKKQKKRRKKSAGTKRRRKHSTRKMNGGETQSPRMNIKKHTEERTNIETKTG